MRYTTRTPAVVLLLLAAACGAADTSRDERPGPSDRQLSMAWRVDTLAAGPTFRARGFGRGDTIWGIDGSRVAWWVPGRAVTRTPHTAWDVSMRHGDPTWRDQAGLHVRGADGGRLLVRADAAGGEFLGPDVSWSPGGERALLTWSGEGPVRAAVLEADSLRWLTSLLPGSGIASSAVWLDDRRVILPVTAFAPRRGPAEYREGGFRAELALLDVAADSMRHVTDAADGEFYSVAGLAPEGILAGVRTGPGVPARHVTLDTADWSITASAFGSGRAATAGLPVALLRPQTGDGEPRWRLDLVSFADTAGILNLQGHDVRTTWHPDSPPRLLIVQESETAGIRAWLIRAYVVNP